jgi:hypothetical protein
MDKPLVLSRQFLWAAGRLPTDIDGLYLYSHTLTSDEVRKKLDLFYRPFRLEVVLILTVAFAIGWKEFRSDFKKTLVLVLATFSFSTIPGLITYPVIHIIGVVFVTSGTLFYVVAGGLVSETVVRVLHHTTFGKAVPAH